MLFGGVDSPLADTTPAPTLAPTRISNPPQATLGITTIYNTLEQQQKGVIAYDDILNYGIAVPFKLPPKSQIPASKKLFDKNVVPKLVDALGDSSVTKAWFHFQAGNTATAGNKLFTVDAPLGGKLYSVVASWKTA
jgi:hypothetical protein